ncbi:MAG: DUF1679 domain-containing protein [Pseudomonadales bacterium]|nr:DUF1679 domain-containing protein [Pseudomonadales bacterium]
MHKALQQKILHTMQAKSITKIVCIQTLWSGYGELLRVFLAGSSQPSIIIKHINLAKIECHPKGWNDDFSHQRKLNSYQIEARWYRDYAHLCDSACTVPLCLSLEHNANNIILMMSDLETAGFTRLLSYQQKTIKQHEIHSGLNWLAAFHARFMGSSGEDLWPTGSYWHLQTRPNELQALQDQDLKSAAQNIDDKLKKCSYQTLIHGDAKLANFCFSEDGKRAAAVDFQYVGKGCGIKDVVYFISSCVSNDDCFTLEQDLLNHYFNTLIQALSRYHPQINAFEVESQWRVLYPVAWADFVRFLKGWSPEHWKLGSYSEALTLQAIDDLP